MVRVLIIEDHEEEAQHVKEAIVRLSDSSTLSYEITIITENFNEEKLSGYDLYFLDINMGLDNNGFEIAKTIQQQNSHACIVFCSNHENLVFESFRLDVMFFVRKSHLDQDIKEALCKFEKVYAKRLQFSEKWIGLDRSKQKVQMEDIIYLESDDNYTIIHLKANDEIRIKMSLKKVMDQLRFEKLILISRSIAVNLLYVTGINGNFIYMGNKQQFSASQRKMSVIKKLILESDD